MTNEIGESLTVPVPEPPAPGLPLAGNRIAIHVPDRHNPTLQRIMAAVAADDELYTLWYCQNVNAVDRLGMTDHGPVHVQIVANIALRLLRLLLAKGIRPNVVRDHGLTNEDAEVVVVLAALMHDLGMSIHRIAHEEYSLFVAQQKLADILPAAYPDPVVRTVIRSEILHAIIAHRRDGRPLTLEAGIVRVADALDMAQGRSRIPFERGELNIHSVSAMAIEKVTLEPGETKPVRARILMRNSAGIFQIDELLKEKLRGSGLEDYIEVIATIERETEAPLVQIFRL